MKNYVSNEKSEQECHIHNDSCNSNFSEYIPWVDRVGAERIIELLGIRSRTFVKIIGNKVEVIAFSVCYFSSSMILGMSATCFLLLFCAKIKIVS